MTKVERERIWVIIVLAFFTITFWAFFEQAGSSITLFTDLNVNREIFGFTIPTSVYQSVNPLFIIMLAPIFSSLRSEEHTSELQSRPHLVCRLLLEKKKKNNR